MDCWRLPRPFVTNNQILSSHLLLSINHVLTLLYVKHVRDYELDGEMANGSVVFRKHLVLMLEHRDFFVFSTQNYLVTCFSSNFLSFWHLINNF